jgi:hypothetical protein
MQSFDPHSDVANEHLKVSSYPFLRNPPELFFRTASGIRVILSGQKVSSHDLPDLCTSFVTSVQYEKPLLYYSDTFVPSEMELFSSKCVPGLSCRKRSSCHFILRSNHLIFQWTAPDPFSLASFPVPQLRYCRMNTGVQEVFFNGLHLILSHSLHFQFHSFDTVE